MTSDQTKHSVHEEWAIEPAGAGDAEHALFEILADIEIFVDLTSSELQRVGWMLHERTYLPDEIIVHQGAPGVGMYIIQAGSAYVQLATSDNRVIRLATLGERQFFGEMSLLDGAPRAASVVAIERVQALGFFKADLMGLLDHAPRLGLKIIQQVSRIMARRLRETVKEYRGVSRQLRMMNRGGVLPASIVEEELRKKI